MEWFEILFICIAAASFLTMLVSTFIMLDDDYCSNAMPVVILVSMVITVTFVLITCRSYYSFSNCLERYEKYSRIAEEYERQMETADEIDKVLLDAKRRMVQKKADMYIERANKALSDKEEENDKESIK